MICSSKKKRPDFFAAGRFIYATPSLAAALNASSAETRSSPTLNQHLAAIAVMLDFVNPLRALWRLIDRRSELAG
jgi:hypothetical protein